MSLLSKFTKRSTLSPIQKLVNSEVVGIDRKLENSVNDLFTKGLSSAGLSSSVVNELSSRFGDSISSDLADEFFRTATSEINRVTKLDIFNGVSSRFTETNVGSIDRLDNEAEVEGVSDVYQFPNQMGKYYVSLKFREYVRPAPQVSAKLNFKNAIVLPVPNNLEEAFNLDISTQSTGLTGGLADIIQTSTSEGGKDFKASSSIGAMGYSFLAQNVLSDSVQSIVGQYLGSVPNPHLATIFNGISMRQFRFDWTFHPRNAKESADLEVLINKLKQNSLPAFSTLGTAVLQYPYLCFVELQPWHSDGKPLIEYKPAMIANVTINKSPNGIPSFFEGTNLPTFIQLSIDFLETEYFTSNDFGRGGRTAEDGDKLASGLDAIKGAAGDLLEVIGVEDGEAAIEQGINSIDETISTGSSEIQKVTKNPDGTIYSGDL